MAALRIPFPPRNFGVTYNAALIELRHELGTKQQLGWNVDCERAVLSMIGSPTRSI